MPWSDKDYIRAKLQRKYKLRCLDGNLGEMFGFPRVANVLFEDLIKTSAFTVLWTGLIYHWQASLSLQDTD